MENLPEVIELGPDEEAQRLWTAALEARVSEAHNLISLCSAINLGLRTCEILIVHHLQAVKSEFPATVAAQLDTPSPEVDAYRDGINVPKSLQFSDILDLLSEEELDCVSPGMHRGWEDRRFSCRRSRRTAQEAVGITLAEEARDQLLLLAAYRNRIFRCPPPTRILTKEIHAAFEHLVALAEKLLTL